MVMENQEMVREKSGKDMLSSLWEPWKRSAGELKGNGRGQGIKGERAAGRQRPCLHVRFTPSPQVGVIVSRG